MAASPLAKNVYGRLKGRRTTGEKWHKKWRKHVKKRGKEPRSFAKQLSTLAAFLPQWKYGARKVKANNGFDAAARKLRQVLFFGGRKEKKHHQPLVRYFSYRQEVNSTTNKTISYARKGQFFDPRGVWGPIILSSLSRAMNLSNRGICSNAE